MKTKTIIASCIAVTLIAGTLVFAQVPRPVPPAPPVDPRIDKVIELNQQILQKQDDILKQLEEVKSQLAALRRRSS